MEEKAAQELVYREAHDPLTVAVSRVPPSECNLAVCERNQSAVGDGNAVGVGAQVAENVLRTAERWLGVDDPVVAEQGSAPGCKGSWLSECRELAMELEIALAESGLERGDELTAEDTAEHFDGKEKGLAG